MKAQGQWITLRDDSSAKAVVAPELGGWLLRYSRHLPSLGYVDALLFSQEVVDRYPNQMYAGNPLLFPQVSFTHLPGNEHHYAWEAKTFALPQHGFARRMKWKVTGVTENRLTMELSDTPETRAAYPFSFRCIVIYELQDGRLHFRQTIQNRGDTPMPFSTGIHPYLPVPIGPRGARADCVVELPSCNRVVPAKDWSSWRVEPFPDQNLPVQQDVSGTLFLTDLERAEISLVDRAARLRITLNFEDAPQHRFVALWSRSTSDPFYCVEPWTALPNSFSRTATELILLPPGDTFEAGMWLEISPLDRAS